MKTSFLILVTTGLCATAAFAEPQTRTATYEGPNATGTRVTVRDPAAGTYAHDTNVTRISDGATASRSVDRARTDTGVTASGTSTGFGGRTRSFDYERTRTDTGFTATGSATGVNGRTYDYAADRTRTGNGYVVNQTVTSGGRTLFDRNVVATRGNGQLDRTVTTSRAAGFGGHRFGGGRRH